MRTFVLIVFSWFEKIDWTVLRGRDRETDRERQRGWTSWKFSLNRERSYKGTRSKYFKKVGYLERGYHTPLPTTWCLIVPIYLSFSALLSGWRLNVWGIQWKGETASDGHTEMTWFGIHLTTYCVELLD